ncbi:cilia- and flagella-associated protein 161 [Pycnococcus provasolii]
MQYYTKQQLQGASRYYGKCRIGNWNEDVELEEVLLKQYLEKREQGGLKLDKFQARIDVALAPCELSRVSDDGYVHFGDLLAIRSAANGAVLSTSLDDRDQRAGEDAYGATAAPADSATAAVPCARCSFLLSKFVPNEVTVTDELFDDDLLHYGQKVCVVANPMCESKPLDAEGSEDPLMLRSLAKSTTSFAKFSRQQEVAFTHQPGYATAWVVIPTNPKHRLAAHGSPVPRGVPVVLQHCATGQDLHLEVGQPLYNDFGMEYEVSGFTQTSLARSAIMEGLTTGKAKADLSKMEAPTNFWVLESGEKVKQLPQLAQAEFTVENVLAKVMKQLNRKGANGIFGLRAVFKEMDADGSGQLNAAEFRDALRYCMIDITDKELVKVLESLDTDNSGSISPDEFVEALTAVADIGKREHVSV